MKNYLKKQIKVQGTKEFGNIKGVKALNVKELREVEGGIINPILVGLGLAGGAFYFGWELGREFARK